MQGTMLTFLWLAFLWEFGPTGPNNLPSPKHQRLILYPMDIAISWATVLCSVNDIVNVVAN